MLRTRHLVPVHTEILIETSVLLVQIVRAPAPEALLCHWLRPVLQRVVDAIVRGSATVARVEHVVRAPTVLAAPLRDVVQGWH